MRQILSLEHAYSTGQRESTITANGNQPQLPQCSCCLLLYGCSSVRYWCQPATRHERKASAHELMMIIPHTVLLLQHAAVVTLFVVQVAHSS